jgi:hypothetical protein
LAKIARYDRIIDELWHFYKVSLIKTGLMFHKKRPVENCLQENVKMYSIKREKLSGIEDILL